MAARALILLAALPACALAFLPPAPAPLRHGRGAPLSLATRIPLQQGTATISASERQKRRSRRGAALTMQVQQDEKSEQDTLQNEETESFYFAKRIDPKAGVNLGLLGTLVRNQLLLGASSWWTLSNLSEAGTPLALNTAFGLNELVIMLVGAVPVGILGYYISKSDNDLLYDLNTSTDLLVLSMFGKKKSIPTAAFVSTGISMLTGLCEELSFRAILIPVLAARIAGEGEPSILLGYLAATLSFAAAHMSFGSSLKENGITLALQTMTGLWFGLVFIFSGFNLFVASGVHAIYDAFTLLETHVSVTGQISYAEERTLQEDSKIPNPPTGVWKRVDELVQQGEVDAGFRRYACTLFFMADRDQDGQVDRDELAYAFKQFGRVLTSDEISQLFAKVSGRGGGRSLRLDQFVATVLELKYDKTIGRPAEVGRKQGFLGVR